jgi:hypothetical protein
VLCGLAALFKKTISQMLTSGVGIVFSLCPNLSLKESTNGDFTFCTKCVLNKMFVMEICDIL